MELHERDSAHRLEWLHSGTNHLVFEVVDGSGRLFSSYLPATNTAGVLRWEIMPEFFAEVNDGAFKHDVTRPFWC